MTREEFEEENYRNVMSLTVDKGNLKINTQIANLNLLDYDSIEYAPTTIKNEAAEQMCFGCELLLKGGIIFDDFRKHPRYSKDPYSPGNDKILANPDKILQNIILENDDQDVRSILKSFHFEDEKRRKGTLINSDTGAPLPNKDERDYNMPLIAFQLYQDSDSYLGGHNPYPYFQLQSPISRSLIDTDFYCKASESFNWTFLALLTEDIITRDENGKSIMPRDQMEFLDDAGNSSVKLRYPYSNINVSDDLLLFIKDFSLSVQSVSNFRFPSPVAYSRLDVGRFDYSDFNGQLSCLNFLDKTSRYRLKCLFSPNEINSLICFKNNLKLSDYDFIKLVYNSIYLKDYVKNILDINLEFTEKQFLRVYNLCYALQAYQIFDPNNKRFRDTISPSKKDIYIHRCEEMSNSNLKIKHKSLFDELGGKYSEDDICNLLNSEEYKSYPHLFTANNCLKHGIDELKKFVSSDIFLKHKDLISSNNLLVNNDLIYIYTCLDDDFMNNYPGLICTEVLRKTTLNKIF